MHNVKVYRLARQSIKRGAFTVGAGLATLAMCACEIITPPINLPQQAGAQAQADQGRIINTRSANATPLPQASVPALTTTVKRGTLQDTVVMSGRVQPARSSQLAFRTAGTVTAVSVRSGQAVRAGDPIAQVSLDDAALQTAQQQATIADLAYQSQLTHVQQIEAGQSAATPATSIDDARAAVVKAQLDLQTALNAREAGRQSDNPDVVVAQLDLDAANDVLAQAQAAQRQAEAATAQTTENAVDSPDAYAVRVAQSRLASANANLLRVQAHQSSSQRSRQLEVQRAQVAIDQATENLARAQLAAQQAPDLGAQKIAAANAALRSAQRAVDQANIRVSQPQSKDNTTNSNTNSNATDFKLAQLDLQAAQDTLADAQAAAQRAPQDAQAIQSAADDAVRTANRSLQQAQATLEETKANSQDADEQELATAQNAVDQANVELGQAQAKLTAAPSVAAAAVRNAERSVITLTLKLNQARAQQANGQSALVQEYADLQVAAAQSAVVVAQNRLEVLLNPATSATPGPDIATEEKRAALLLTEATAAKEAAQPIVTLRAPFDGSVASIDLQVGQSVQPNSAVGRIVDSRAFSVNADAYEVDVARLSNDMPVVVTFSGISAIATGKVSEIGGIGTASSDRVSFPVRIDLDGAPQGLLVGMTASVSASTRQEANALYVPATAIRIQNGTSMAMRIGPDNQVQQIPVVVGGTFGSNVQILSGLEEGDAVGIFSPAEVTAGTVR